MSLRDRVLDMPLRLTEFWRTILLKNDFFNSGMYFELSQMLTFIPETFSQMYASLYSNKFSDKFF